jgi:hypothetical protein
VTWTPSSQGGASNGGDTGIRSRLDGTAGKRRLKPAGAETEDRFPAYLDGVLHAQN